MIILNKEHREICSREVTGEIPNSETISAINEVQQMKQNPSLGKSYTDRQNDDRLDNIKSFIFSEGSI